MKTVLFIDKTEGDLWPTFQKYDYLLDEYRSDGTFGVCPWNRDGMSVDAAIPDLRDVLGTEEKWQAVIVTDLRQDDDALRDDVHFDNPFDYPDRYDVRPGDGFVESEHSLVRLTHMLGGFPEKAFVEWGESGHAGAILGGLELGYGVSDVQYDLLERYRLGTPRPERVICVTPRDVDRAFVAAREHEFEYAAAERERERSALVAERERALDAHERDSEAFERLEDMLRVYEREDNAAELGFWERNDYPSLARFIVVDRLAPSVETPEGVALAEAAKSAYRPDEREAPATRSFWFDFWMCVLSLMVSTVLPGDLRAYEVYRMKSTIDEHALSASFGKRRVQWTTACDKIDERLEKDRRRLKSSESDKARMPDTQVTIPVVFDSVRSESLYTDPSAVALTKDYPEKDFVVWAHQRQESLGEFRELLRAPRRALRLAADMFRGQKPLPYDDLEYCVLNATEKDLLDEDVRNTEAELVTGAGGRSFEYEATEDDFDEADKDVKGAIGKRATRPQSFAVLAIALVTLIVGFLPYILGITLERRMSLWAGLVTAVCCLIMVVVFVVTLVRMRNEVRGAYRGFNDVMRGIVENLHAQAGDLEHRMSAYATFRKKWSVLERQEHLDTPTRESDRLNRCKALLKTRICDIDEVANRSDMEADVSGYSFDPTWRQMDALLQDESFYNIRDAALRRDGSEGLGSGSFADVPYEFIVGLSLEPLKTA